MCVVSRCVCVMCHVMCGSLMQSVCEPNTHPQCTMQKQRQEEDSVSGTSSAREMITPALRKVWLCRCLSCHVCLGTFVVPWERVLVGGDQ